jgi:ATP-binding cassette subfamily B multidrug efflux pump
MLYKLWKLARPSRGLLLLTLCLVLLSTVSGLGPPWVIRYAIDSLIIAGKKQLLWAAALVMVFLSLLEIGCNFGARYLAECVGQGALFRLRNILYRHLHTLSFSFFDGAGTGDIISRLTVDIGILNNFFGLVIVNILANSLLLIGIMAVMFYWDWQLGLVFLLITPALIHGIAVYAGRVQPGYGKVNRQLGKMSNVLEESIMGINLVKLTGSEDYEQIKFDQQHEKYLTTSLEVIKTTALWQPYVQFLAALAAAAALWSGGRAVIEGRVSPGVLVGFITYMGMLVRTLRMTGRMVGVITRASAAGQRVIEILQWKPAIRDLPGAYPLPQVKGRVSLAGVHFSYDGQNEILKDINFTAEPGQMVALVGSTGSGKTTLVHLLARFYEPTRGKIMIDGHDIKGVTLESLRRQVGVVFQDTFVFDASVRENIAYGKPDASQAEIERVAKLAQIHDFITALPRGYHTQVGTRGMALSGGERQRLAIARVLLTDPQLLVLDEATSELDAQTEGALHAALQEIVRNRTVFVIAHRLWTIQNADNILLLSRGRIAETGSHHQLLAAGGMYSRFYENFLQSKFVPGKFEHWEKGEGGLQQ